MVGVASGNRSPEAPTDLPGTLNLTSKFLQEEAGLLAWNRS